MAVLRFCFLMLLACLPAARTIAREVPAPDYSTGPRDQVPEAFRWKVEDVYPTEEAWRADLARAKADLEVAAAMGKDWTSSPRRMADFLELYETLNRRATRLGLWASLQQRTHLTDARFQDLESQARQFSVDLNSAMAAMDADVLGLGREGTDSCLKAEPRLVPYRALLEESLRKQDHFLPANAEEVVAGTDLFSGGPRTAADFLLRELPNPEIVLPDSSRVTPDRAARRRLLTSADPRERRAAHEGVAANRRRFGNTFAALMDMGAKRDLFQARSHRFPDCLSAELFQYDVDPSVYVNLVQTIRDNLGPYHRYLRLRARMLHLAELRPCDNYLPTVPGDPLRFTFEEARSLVRESTSPLGPEYAALVGQAFDGRWLDVYPHQDKAGLGSAISGYGVHPYVLLNYQGDFFDLITVTHELGHALSFYVPEQAQPFATAQISWFLSEVPSTFNEVLLMQHLVDRQTDDRARLVLLSEFLDRLNTLLFFTAQGADFQLAIHRQVEAGGALSAEWLDAKQLELSRHYGGHESGVMKIDDYVRSEWIRPNMLFAPFQDYFYVVGAITSLAFADRIREGGVAEGKKYVAFLKAGSSKPPTALLKEAGLDLNTAEPILRALRTYERLLDQMEAVQARLERQGRGR